MLGLIYELVLEISVRTDSGDCSRTETASMNSATDTATDIAIVLKDKKS